MAPRLTPSPFVRPRRTHARESWKRAAASPSARPPVIDPRSHHSSSKPTIWSPETTFPAWCARAAARQGTEAFGVVRLAFAVYDARAGDRHFAEDRPHGQIVLPLAGLGLPTGDAVAVRL